MKSLDEEFEKWIVQNGGTILPTTNQYELLRYKIPEQGTCVIYINGKGKINLSGVSEAHYKSFSSGEPIKKSERADIRKVKKTIRQSLVERDGNWCWYCCAGGKEVELTLEHIVGIKSGGPNHMSNYALACQSCNSEVGNKPVVEKIIYRNNCQRSYMLGLDPHEDQSHPDYVPWIEETATSDRIP